MKTVTSVQENAEDIYAEAKEINEERAAQDAELGADVTVEETDITDDAEESAEQEYSVLEWSDYDEICNKT